MQDSWWSRLLEALLVPDDFELALLASGGIAALGDGPLPVGDVYLVGGVVTVGGRRLFDFGATVIDLLRKAKRPSGIAGRYSLRQGGSYISGSVNNDGILTFLVMADGGAVRGRELFDLMMRSFAAQKVEVKAIKGEWLSGSNRQACNALTDLGVCLDTAAELTWTARRAADHGFTDVRVIKFEGRPGAYTDIEVLFVKKP